jgi:hypothetical protein
LNNNFQKILLSIQHIEIFSCLVYRRNQMKKILQKIVIVWASIAALIGFQKKDREESLNDAIRFPDLSEKNVVEDYEMAAYHNQA